MAWIALRCPQAFVRICTATLKARSPHQTTIFTTTTITIALSDHHAQAYKTSHCSHMVHI